MIPIAINTRVMQLKKNENFGESLGCKSGWKNFFVHELTKAATDVAKTGQKFPWNPKLKTPTVDVDSVNVMC
jgi:hypothetical protein